MPTFNDPAEPEFAQIEKRDRWFANVLLFEYGELASAPGDADVPTALNWLLDVPGERRYDFEDAECGMVYVSDDGAYACSIWDVSGEHDDPWAVFVVDPFGARLLPEFSVLDERSEDRQRETVLKTAADAIPDQAVAGAFIRTGTPVAIPNWLLVDPDEQGHEEN